MQLFIDSLCAMTGILTGGDDYAMARALSSDLYHCVKANTGGSSRDNDTSRRRQSGSRILAGRGREAHLPIRYT